jgi:hypothetical protein
LDTVGVDSARVAVMGSDGADTVDTVWLPVGSTVNV